MAKSITRKIIKGIAWTVGIIMGLIILVPALLYVPFIQDFVKDIAVREVSSATGMDIALERLRLRWPLRLSLDGVSIVPTPGDTMLTAGRVDVGVRLLPLLKGEIDVDYARLDTAFYQLGTPDSLMWLRARIDRAVISPAHLTFDIEQIDLSSAEIDGADVSLVMKPDTTTTPTDTTATPGMKITAGEITLRRVSYTMQMLPAIDTLRASVPLARLKGDTVDLGTRRIHATSLSVDSVNASYLTPSPQWLKEHPQPAVAAVESTTADTATYVITADSLRLTARRAIYGVSGTRPAPGLDMDWLEVSDVAIAVDSFYNRGTAIRVPLRRLAARERCGLSLSASGLFSMDSTAMSATGFTIATDASQLHLDAMMGINTDADTATLPIALRAAGTLGLRDAVTALPSLRSTISVLPPPSQLKIDADIAGTMQSLNVKRLLLNYPGLLHLAASGRVDNLTDAAHIGGKIDIDGRLTSGRRLSRSLVAARLMPDMVLPETMTVNGDITYHPMQASGCLTVTADGGRLALKGMWNGRIEDYDAAVDIHDFPLQDFVPAAGVGDITAGVTARGRGYNPLRPSTTMTVAVDVTRVVYNGRPLENLMLRADAGGGHAEGTLSSGAADADLDIDFAATVTDTTIAWDIDGDIRRLDLHALGLMADTCEGTAMLASKGVYYPHTRAVSGGIDVNALDWRMGTMRIDAPATSLTASLTDSTIVMTAASGDLDTRIATGCGLETLLARAAQLTPLLSRQIAAHNINIDSIQRALPPFHMAMRAGSSNPLAELLAGAGTHFGSVALTASNDSLISLNGRVTGFTTGTTRLDTINITAQQHGSYLVYSAMVNNRPGTMDNFAHVTVNGFLGHDRLSAMVNQRNIKNDVGFRIGFSAMIADSTVTMRLVPGKPVIAYRQWKLNPDNFISYNLYDHRLKADLSLADSISSLRLHTITGADTTGTANDDLKVELRDIRLQDWLSLSPWAPPMKGSLSADMLIHLGRHDITGTGSVGLHDFFYNNQRVGTFDASVNVATDPRTGLLRAGLDLMVDSIKTVTVNGVLNDSTATNPFMLDFKMIRFPLSVANAFLPQGVAKLSGMLNGSMDITGSMEHPVFNGWINFDTTTVDVTMLGTPLRFSDEKIPVDSGIVKFNGFDITACNDNPLTIEGTANLRDLANIAMDLKLNATNMMVVNSSRPRRGADVSGKGYIDLDATVRGNMELLIVNANLALLSGSNVTYVVPPSTSTVSSAAAGVDDMVHFVSFNDTARVAKADSVARSMALVLTAGLNIHEGTTLTVDLSGDGKVQVQGGGDLNFTMSPVNTGRLIGRYTINKGMARYNVPMLGEKSFDLLEGSYVAFNGDMLNPLLNIHAMDHMKANVTQSGQNSRLVEFDVALNVTGSLTQMNVVFDLSTDDDITVQNELQSMSPEQRANQAMNLLLYNTYTGPGTTANANLSGNPLYSFLESQLNSWMANNIRSVDISFGIDQYDRTLDGSTATTTSYSYRVSKSLFDDRFKIVVGGNYSTDANADENFSQNLISDISFEYMLNKAGSMYVRIFRHTGYESILEGEVTQTGVGFVIKRKLNSLRDFFRRPKQAKAIAPTSNTPSDQ